MMLSHPAVGDYACSSAVITVVVFNHQKLSKNKVIVYRSQQQKCRKSIADNFCESIGIDIGDNISKYL